MAFLLALVWSFNPAVAVGISVMGLVSWASIWIYLVANLLGGAAAIFKIANRHVR